MAPDAERIDQIAAMLDERPGTFGRPIGDRDAWEAIAETTAFDSTVSRSESILRRPIPPMSAETYRAIVASGSRADHYRLYNQRPGTLSPLCIAECIENQGRFLPRIEALLEELCREATWIVPLRKQQSIDNLEGRRNTIDLNKAIRAWEMALTDALLQDRLQPQTRAMIRENLERRIFAPYRAMLTGRQRPDFWIEVTNNWNAVCLAGVTGAALTILEPVQERAWFAAAAEKHSQAFLRGFGEDGYCTEGLGYWNFGFSNYLALSEALWQTTDGQLDLFDRPKVKDIALFGARIEIDNGVYPAFADCVTDTDPMPFILHFMSRRLGLGLNDWERGEMTQTSGALYLQVLSAFPNSATAIPPSDERVSTLPARHVFEDAGVLICRPGPDSEARLAVALKGGHNGEHHNHNDVGSFAVETDGRAPILDVGAEVYTNRTFSSQRYESDVLNSYGHPVPVVAGTLQRTGSNARAEVLRAEFSPERDSIALDLRSAYAVPELQRLERTFIYSREGTGSLEVIDHVAFASPQPFGVCLMTLGTCEDVTPSSWIVRDREGAVRVDISATEPIRASVEVIEERLRVEGVPRRLGIDFAEPVAEGRITVRITPLPAPADDSGQLLRNGGFESGADGWSIPADGMGSLQNDRPAEGKTCLRIVDESTATGSNILSDRMRLAPDAAYVLKGKVRSVSGDGVGVYVRLLGRRGERLQETSEQRRMSFMTVGAEPSGTWEDFALPFRTTPRTRYARVWLHTFNADMADVYLDDLRLERAAEPEADQ